MSSTVLHNRVEILEELANNEYDVTIIGGGISGAWLALHCAQAGYKTALIEKHDYASQTSSSSSKLLHGGIRYLQQMQFFKVRESALERAHYIYAAPHLSKAVPFIIPTYKDILRSKFLLSCGMFAYRLLCAGQNKLIASSRETLPAAYSVGAKKLDQLCKLNDQNHTGGVVFYERHMHNSERMALSILNTARDLGAQTINYVSAQDICLKENKVEALIAKDEYSERSFKIKTSLVINAAGPWIDQINALIDKDKPARINGFAVGSHLITRKVSDYAIALTTKHKSESKINRGGRHIFVIPWRDYSLIGTSYDEIDSPEQNLAASSEHCDQLLETVNEALPNASLRHEDLISSYSGLYPLRTNNLDSAIYQGSGEYQVVDHAKGDNIDGLITALGAKFTTARKLSALTMKIVGKKLGGVVNQANVRLNCSEYDCFSEFSDTMVVRYSELLPIESIQHLLINYGSDFESVLERIKDHPPLLEPISENLPDIMGQVVWATEREQAETLDDILFRRTSLGLLGISTHDINRVADVLAQQLSWSSDRKSSELKNCLDKMKNIRQTLDNASAVVAAD